MKVFLTGASGFIGSQVAQKLVEADQRVLALALPGDPLWRLKNVAGQLELLRGTLEDREVLSTSLMSWSPDVCIHLAWYVEPGNYLDSNENITSLKESLNLIDLLAKAGCKKIVVAGTCFEYRLQEKILCEEDEVKPESLYAASKLALQVAGEKLAAQVGMEFVWGRVFYLYGPGEHPKRLVPAVISALQKGEKFAVSPGLQVRDYLHVEDVASAFLQLAENGVSGIYNISSANPVTIKDLLSVIGNVLQKTELLEFGAVPYRASDPAFVCGSNQRLRALGWAPKFEIADGLKQTIDWWMRSEKE
jgi:nucleoside-diphosphate-sugar epimerase